MSITSLSLLERFKRTPTGGDWERLHDLYNPLIRSWIARIPQLQNEADDLTQEVLLVAFREIALFERRRDGSFRAWLRRVTVNRVRDYLRKRARQPMTGLNRSDTDDFLALLEDPTSSLSIQWDREHEQHVVNRLLATVRDDFKTLTWAAFQKFALEGMSAKQTALELGISENAVILAKSRILQRLRQEAGVLLD